MYHSLHHTIINLPEETIIYPGHNYGPTPTDTLKNQKQDNPYLNVKSKEAFIRKRTGKR